MYQVLARKYRPRNFSQLVGQTHVSRALTSALERGRLHHAYLFTGTRGVGKTTIARILAKCLNCETGVTATPCEQCTVCKSVNEGRFIDLIEIDAASRTRVEDTRELLDNVPYAPTQGRYKVYLIDEVHMLSTHSFNALLKTLEEPPEHVKFLFATTDPQKLPITVISRCLQFTLRPLGKDEIFSHLDHILNEENIQHQSEALWQLAESAQGSLRDALSLTDQAIAYGQGQVSGQDVKEMLGLIDKSLVFDLLRAIHQNQRQQVATIIQKMRQQAIDVQHVLEQLISTLHEVALLQVLGTTLEQSQEENQYKQQLAQLIVAQDLQLYYQIALQGRADLSLSLTPEQGFEMCVMRLLAFRPLAVGEVVPESNDSQVIPSQTSTENMVNTVESVVHPPKVPIENDIQEYHQDAKAEEQRVIAPIEDIELSVIESIAHHHIEEDEQLSVNVVETQDVGLEYSHEELSNIVEESNSEIAIEQTTFSSVQSETQFNDSQDLIDNENTEVESIQNSISLETIEEVEDVSNASSINPMVIAPELEQGLIAVNIDDPRVLLQAQPQELIGDWTVEKWDYWLRQSNLSPAVKELAQQGVVRGAIDGESELMLDPSYQRIFDGFVETLKAELQELNAQLILKVTYQTIDSITPVQLQQQRKELAYHTAEHKILQQPVILALTEKFSATLEHLKLKS